MTRPQNSESHLSLSASLSFLSLSCVLIMTKFIDILVESMPPEVTESMPLEVTCLSLFDHPYVVCKDEEG